MEGLLSSSELLQQGAEGRVYRGVLWEGRPAILKHRFAKGYRHPALDRRLTAARTAAEARALQRAAKASIPVPAVLAVDAPSGILALEPIAGPTVRAALGAPHEAELSGSLVPAEGKQGIATPLDTQAQTELMKLVGQTIARLHAANLVHGDLTTSNLLVRRTGGQDEVVLIDFGLASQSTLAEDKAVDLYVLERAFGSTHPYTPHLFEILMQSYFEELASILAPRGKKARQGAGAAVPAVEEIRRKLDDVRLRGRKRDMTG